MAAGSRGGRRGHRGHAALSLELYGGWDAIRNSSRAKPYQLGYAPRVFTATRHVLDGGFGAFEVSPWRDVAARVEYDSEKWNVGAGVGLGFGLRLRIAALNFESLSAGASWRHEL